MNRVLRISVLAVLLGAACMPGLAQEPGDDAAATQAVDPRAMDALDRMGKALHSMNQFSLRADATKEVVMEDGQKLEFGGSVNYKVRPPNGLYAELNTDRKKRQYFYDGKTLTIYAPSTRYYATLPAPGTLGELVAAVRSYGLEMPLSDLFVWGTDKAPKTAITSATYVGPARIGERNVAQYAFRQEGVDWQVWLDGEALPRKLVITDLGEAERPEYTALLDWDKAPQLSDASFRFTPGNDAYEIEFIPAVAATDKP